MKSFRNFAVITYFLIKIYFVASNASIDIPS